MTKKEKLELQYIMKLVNSPDDELFNLGFKLFDNSSLRKKLNSTIIYLPKHSYIAAFIQFGYINTEELLNFCKHLELDKEFPFCKLSHPRFYHFLEELYIDKKYTVYKIRKIKNYD